MLACDFYTNLAQLGFILALKTCQNQILEASWGVLGASWRPLGASWARLGLGASRRRLGASWARGGASWRLLGASWRRLGAFQAQKAIARCQERSFAVARRTHNYQRRRRLQRPLQTSTDLYRPLDLYRSPSNARRHAAGRLRAWCGSNA